MKKKITAEKKIGDAREMLVRRWPFFARLALSPTYAEASWLETMATDGASIFWNRAFVDGMTMEELVFVLAHEGAHNGFAHHVRRGERDHDLWNQACDYVINPILKEAGLTMPADGLLDARFTSAMSAEQIYKILERERMQQQQNGGQGAGQPQAGKPSAGAGKPQMATAPDGRTVPDNGGGIMDLPAGEDGTMPGPGEIAQEIRAAQAKLAQALSVAKRRGKVPAGLETSVSAALAPKVDWRTILADWCTELSTSDYSWRKPHRGYLVEAGIYAPSAHDRTMGPLVVASDVSGSVGDDDFRQFSGELVAVHAALRPSALHDLQFDTKVHAHRTYGPDDQLELGTRYARGGTAFQPIFDYLAEQGIEPAGVVVLTDLWGDNPVDPGYPVLWVSTDPAGRTPAFGQRVDLI